MHNELEHEQTVARLLRALPDDSARPYDWREFQRRVQAAPAAAARVAGMRALAAASVVAVALGAAAIRLSGGPHPQHPPAAGVTAGDGAPAAAGAGGTSESERDEALAERWLASLPREPAVVNVGTRAAVETLEDHIAQVDDLLSTGQAHSAPPAQLQTLQRRRAQLVSSLVQVRYAETLADASR